MVKLQWIQVNKFRAVKPGTQLTFNPDYNVLLGQNGTGKTTLLNLIAAVINSNFNDFKDEEFDISYALTSGAAVASVKVRNEAQLPPIPLGREDLSILYVGGVDAAEKMHSALMSFSATISGSETGVQVRIEGSDRKASVQLVDKLNSGTPLDLNFRAGGLAVSTIMWSGLNRLVNELSLSQVDYLSFADLLFGSRTSRFDESLEYFVGLGEFKTTLYQRLDGSEPVRVLGDGTIDEQLAAKAKREWGESQYVFNDTELQFLSRIVHLLDVKSAEAVLELRESKKIDEIDVMVLGHLRFLFLLSNGSKISEQMLSYGQKRMLAFMYYLDSTPSNVIADELVNGLHHRWIRSCLEFLGERQKFLTSQNPLLLDYLSFKSPADVRSTFVLCSWDKPSGQMLWERMTEEIAEDFFASYKVGFQQAGELLQARGLW